MKPARHDRGTGHQSVLQPIPGAQRVEPPVVLAHVIGAVRLRADTERDDLNSDDHQQRSGDQGVQIPQPAEQMQAGEDEQRGQHSEDAEHQPGDDEQIERAVDE